MNWIWQRDPTVCPTCEHPTRLHNTAGCVMPDCACTWKGRALSNLVQFAGLFIGVPALLALVVWLVVR